MKGETMEYKGRSFNVDIEREDGMREPWKEHDGHGIVSDWTTREKSAGERVLASDRNSKRYYDVQETMKIAKRDGWGIGDDEKAALTAKLHREPTAREIRVKAVERDFEHLRRWCADEWFWCGVIVTMLDDDGNATDHTASLWGIESDEYAYHREVANELADECIHEWQKAEESEIAETHAEFLV